MTRRLIHMGGGVIFRMQDSAVAVASDVPRKMQRLTKRAQSVQWRPRLVDHQQTEKLRYGPCRLVDRHSDQCAWIGHDGLCCGLKTGRDPSWCPEHGDIVYGRVRLLEAAE